MKPRQFVPDSLKVLAIKSKQKAGDWVAQQRCGFQSRKAAVHGWIHRKKEDAKQPPWPRFHPLPAKPVFEPNEETFPGDPEIYGRFGSSDS